MSLNHYYLWPFCGSTYSCPDSVGSTAGLSLRSHYSGLSVAQQLLVTLSPSLRPVLPVVLEVDSRTILEVEVDTYGESRGGSRGRHRAQSLDSTRLAPEAWLGIASYIHQVQTCLAWQTFCFLPLCWYQFHRSDQIFVWGCLREVAIRFSV